MTILEKIKFEEDWLSEVNLTKENIKIAFAGIRATALEQQPCEDCVSREQALQVIEKEKQGWEGSERYAIDECHSRIAELPSVTPKALEQQPMHGYKIDWFTPTAQAWLSTFNTESATECFTAVQELKKRLENINED